MNKKKKLDQNTIQTAKRLLKYMTGTHKIQFIIVFICIFISSAASIAVSLSLKFLLDDFIIPLIGQTDPNFAELAPEKDVDCMTDLSMSGVFTGKKIGFPPCTPQACMEILDHYGIDCTGKKAVVIGRSLVVGKPAAMMLVKKNATVTICHTRTVDMPSVAREADIIIVAAGRAGVVGAEYVKEGQTIIDVGINVNAEGKLCGDVDYAAVEPIVDAITPVPGGVGSVTTSVLVGHVVEAAMRKVNA